MYVNLFTWPEISHNLTRIHARHRGPSGTSTSNMTPATGSHDRGHRFIILYHFFWRLWAAPSLCPAEAKSSKCLDDMVNFIWSSFSNNGLPVFMQTQQQKWYEYSFLFFPPEGQFSQWGQMGSCSGNFSPALCTSLQLLLSHALYLVNKTFRNCLTVYNLYQRYLPWKDGY